MYMYDTAKPNFLLPKILFSFLSLPNSIHYTVFSTIHYLYLRLINTTGSCGLHIAATRDACIQMAVVNTLRNKIMRWIYKVFKTVKYVSMEYMVLM